jgi:hypothetical protein
MAGWATLDPTTREALVTELVQMHPYYKVRDFDPDSPLDPIIIDTRNNAYVDLAGNILRADGSSPTVQTGQANGLAVSISKSPFPIWLIFVGLAGLLLLSKKGKLI